MSISIQISQIELVSVAALQPNPRNARTHSKRQIRLIADSLKAFGFVNPVLVDEADVVVAGHGRLAAAKLLGMSEVPAIRLEHLSEDQKRAYVIADNQLAARAGWEPAILAIELQHLIELDLSFDVTVTGFEVPQIDLIIEGQQVAAPAEEPVPIDRSQPAVTRVGDLWRLGEHRIFCGDALRMASYGELMGEGLAHAVFTDPPYNVPISGFVSQSSRHAHREFAMAVGELSEDGFVAFLTGVMTCATRFSQAGVVQFWCMDWRHQFELMSAGRAARLEHLNTCVWVKNNGGMGSMYRSRHEFVGVFKVAGARHRNNIELGKNGRNRTNVWEYPSAASFSKVSDEGKLNELHPTVKPVAMVADALLDCTARGEVVLDPFLGSGTTLIAAERVRRICRGMELDPLYVDTTVRRWQRLTGEAAIHSASGLSFDALALQREETADV